MFHIDGQKSPTVMPGLQHAKTPDRNIQKHEI